MSIDWEQVTKHEVDRSKWPMMVQLAFRRYSTPWWRRRHGSLSRAAVWRDFWQLLAIAIFIPPMAVVALWVYLSIRWVDHHGGWEVTPAPGDAPRAAAYTLRGHE